MQITAIPLPWKALFTQGRLPSQGICLQSPQGSSHTSRRLCSPNIEMKTTVLLPTLPIHSCGQQTAQHHSKTFRMISIDIVCPETASP